MQARVEITVSFGGVKSHEELAKFTDRVIAAIRADDNEMRPATDSAFIEVDIDTRGA